MDTIKFWLYVATAGFAGIILVKSALIVPEEVLNNPELSSILFISIVALLERCKQLRNRPSSQLQLPDPNVELGAGNINESLDSPDFFMESTRSY